MLTSVLCFCLALVGSAQLYSSNGFSNYGYPGAYGNTMGNNYMGAYSPGSLYGAMSGYPGAMSGYPSGMNGLYGQHMLGNNMGSYGLSGYGSPYNRMGSPASTNKAPQPFLPMQPVRSQSFAMIGSTGGPIDPNCFH